MKFASALLVIAVGVSAGCKTRVDEPTTPVGSGSLEARVAALEAQNKKYAEALEFLELLLADQLPFGGFLVNRCASAPQSSGVPRFGAVPGAEGTVAALQELPERQRRLVAAQESAIAALVAQAPRGAPVWRLPEVGAALHDLADLTDFARALPDPAELLQPR